MNEIQAYILRFLLGDSVPEDVCRAVGYTADEQAFHTFRLVIHPSGFFDEDVYGTPRSMPTLPIPVIKGGDGRAVDGDLPILFGRPEITRRGHTVVLHADVIAGAYFLLSRYEEWMRPDVRDVHGRFPGKESIAHRAGFLRRPLVDDYGRLLRRLLREVGCVAPNRMPRSARSTSRTTLTHPSSAAPCAAWRASCSEAISSALSGAISADWRMTLTILFLGCCSRTTACAPSSALTTVGRSSSSAPVETTWRIARTTTFTGATSADCSNSAAITTSRSACMPATRRVAGLS